MKFDTSTFIKAEATLDAALIEKLNFQVINFSSTYCFIKI
jgi:hypothetical protein